jgi:hypothetical protein
MTERVFIAYERSHSGHQKPYSQGTIYALPDQKPACYKDEVSEEDIQQAALNVINQINIEAMRLDVDYKPIWKMIRRMMLRAEICDHIKGGLW